MYHANKCLTTKGVTCRNQDGLALRTGYCYRHQYQRPLVYTQLLVLPETTYTTVKDVLVYRPIPEKQRLLGLSWIRSIRNNNEEK